MMTFPKLILIKDLLEPVAIAQRRVAKILSKGDDDGLDELFIHGLFILAVSSLECMMNDVLIYLLQAVPEKLAFQEVKVTKDEIFSSIFTRNIIIQQSEKEVVAASYKRFEEYVEYFCKVTAIRKDFTKEKINELREIRETRNLLLHNNLKINDLYKAKAGPNIREAKRNGKLDVDGEYLKSAVRCILYFIEDVERQLKQKYKKYTKVNLMKSTWTSFFKSPLLKFEDYWNVDDEKDTVFSIKKCKYESGLSSGETSLLKLWRSLFTGDSRHLKDCLFQAMSTDYKEKAIFLLMLSERTSLW